MEGVGLHGRGMSNVLYLIGSACLMAGTILNMIGGQG